ncbi:MAG: ATP-binding protein [Labilithrix sp.]|nr:ATP-binding protein [Labilithrix sp.]
MRELLLVFAGLLLVNAVISGVMWARQRTPLHRALFLVWALSMGSLTLQAFVQAERWMVFAFAIPSLGVNLLLADLHGRALDLRPRWRTYLAASTVGLVATAVATARAAPFWMAALPLVAGVTTPLVDVCAQSFSRAGAKPSTMGRLAILALALNALHHLDYPFFRDDPRFAATGFVVAILAGLATSITAPAIILERTAFEVEKLQAEIIAGERLAAIGEAAAVVAHEIRNPLGVISNTTRMLSHEDLSAEGRELLAIQESETLRLDRLVHDLLVVAKPMRPRRVEIDLGDLVRHAAELSKPLASASEVRLEVAVASEIAPGLKGDPDHVLLALTNLLRNAIEAAPKGSEVRASVANAEGGVRVRVDDEGNGIAPDALPNLFEPFFTTRAKGSGLGLAIVSRVMKAHGGTVHASNLPSRGARFELTFRG